MQAGSRFDLAAEIGGSAQEMPRAAIGADSDLDLTAGFAAQRFLAEPAAVIAIAIPLRKSAAGRGAEYTYKHARFQRLRRN